MRSFLSWLAKPFLLLYAWTGLYAQLFFDFAKRVHARIAEHPVVLLFLLTFSVAAFLNPVKIGVLLYGISKLAAFAHMGNWVDIRFFTDAQPKDLQGIERGTAWKRKSMIIAASILAGAWLP